MLISLKLYLLEQKKKWTMINCNNYNGVKLLYQKIGGPLGWDDW